MNWVDMTDRQRFYTLKTMLVFGGGFAHALANAWIQADSTNTETLANAFPDLIQRYGPGSSMYQES